MSYLLLSHWNGRFGNRMHQYAYGVTYSNLNRKNFILPSDWEGTKLFKKQYHTVINNDKLRLYLNQSGEEWHEPDFKDSILKSFDPNISFIDPKNPEQCYAQNDNPVYFDDLCAYGDHIYPEMSKSYLKKVFEFSDIVKNTEAYKYWKSKAGTYDLAHLRRDDISNIEYNKTTEQGYSVLSMDSYYRAFKKFGYDKDNFIWISDDHINQWHKDRPKTPLFGWDYPTGSIYREPYVFDWLEDFLKIYFARTVFRANSSFSWWASFLSPTAKVYSPLITKQLIYGVDAIEEIDLDFIEGNTPHWMYFDTGPKHIKIEEKKLISVWPPKDRNFRVPQSINKY
jgi:hypothetical protein